MSEWTVTWMDAGILCRRNFACALDWLPQELAAAKIARELVIRIERVAINV